MKLRASQLGAAIEDSITGKSRMLEACLDKGRVLSRDGCSRMVSREKRWDGDLRVVGDFLVAAAGH